MLVEPVGPQDAVEISAYLARAMQPPQPEDFWMKLFRPDTAESAGPHGFKLTDKTGAIIGFIATIRTGIPRSDGTYLRLVNLSTFVVDEEHRALAPFLLKQALRYEADVVTNLSPSEKVCDLMRILKFQLFGAGRYLTPTPVHVNLRGLARTVRWETDFSAAHRRLFPELPLPSGLERLSFATLCVADRALVALAPRTKFGVRFAEVLYVRQGREPVEDLLGRVATYLLARRGILLLRYDPEVHGLPRGPFAVRHPRRTQPFVLGEMNQGAWFYLCSELSLLNDHHIN
jgi:hypothetical protein